MKIQASVAGLTRSPHFDGFAKLLYAPLAGLKESDWVAGGANGVAASSGLSVPREERDQMQSSPCAKRATPNKIVGIPTAGTSRIV
jgi:hypothetical protein